MGLRQDSIGNSFSVTHWPITSAKHLTYRMVDTVSTRMLQAQCQGQDSSRLFAVEGRVGIGRVEKEMQALGLLNKITEI